MANLQINVIWNLKASLNLLWRNILDVNPPGFRLWRGCIDNTRIWTHTLTSNIIVVSIRADDKGQKQYDFNGHCVSHFRPGFQKDDSDHVSGAQLE